MKHGSVSDDGGGIEGIVVRERHAKRSSSPRGGSARLWTHHLGWEVRLEINGDLQRSEVFRTQDDVLTAGEAWKAAMIEKGWR